MSSGLWGVIPCKLKALRICCPAMGNAKKWSKILPSQFPKPTKAKHEFDGEK